MRVKIGDTIYDSNQQPIMIIMDDTDKQNISKMADDATKYCSYPDGMEVDTIKDFMKINDNLTREQKYDIVNSCETLEELANVIRTFAGVNGMIEGRKKFFDAEKMANHCENYHNVHPNLLTREFGIRQQAIYIIS